MIVFGICEVIKVDNVVVLAVSEVVGTIVAISVTVALVIDVILIVTMSDLVVRAVIVALTAVVVGSRNVPETSLVLTGVVTGAVLEAV